MQTPWGDPDLQGVWDFRTLTPLERPEALADKAFLTEDRRTSLIVDPPDGRIPWTPERQNSMAELFAQYFGRVPEGPEDRALAERCILGFNSGPPMLPSAYNNNVQLFQTPDHVVIVNEMVHNARIVPLAGQSALTSDVRQWVGDSRGRWEDGTLVVETTNFLGTTSFIGSSEHLRLVERFTRVDADTLLYEFTVEDPKTWTQPWTAAVPMRKTDGPMFEYACHEGNYGMTNLLAGARAQERADP